MDESFKRKKAGKGGSKGRTSGWDLGNGCGWGHRAATLSSLYRNLTPTVHKNALVIAFAPDLLKAAS